LVINRVQVLRRHCGRSVASGAFEYFSGLALSVFHHAPTLGEVAITGRRLLRELYEIFWVYLNLASPAPRFNRIVRRRLLDLFAAPQGFGLGRKFRVFLCFRCALLPKASLHIEALLVPGRSSYGGAVVVAAIGVVLDRNASRGRS
jgi:hypothetical protein